MSDATPVTMSSEGPPETVLADEPVSTSDALADALDLDGPQQRPAVAAVVAGDPRSLFAWAELGRLARDPIEAYACFRVGYHRGLDSLRASGWRGSGYVRWRHPENRGFLRCLNGLHRTATMIGEADESERTLTFLHQLDPSWPPPDL